MALRRELGTVTAFLIGLGVAIGSGIFRTPSLVSGVISAPWMIVGLWGLGGLFILCSGLVSAELSTRFPQAGGEYVYLREAYGELPAFFFGWGYTVFIIGGGAATIAAACGEASAELFGVDQAYARYFGAGALVAVTGINAIGLKAGAWMQNVLTATKVLAIVGVSIAAFTWGDSTTDWTAPLVVPEDRTLFATLVLAFPPVLWAYEGTTDAVKMAEEVDDVHRALPRALIGSALTLTLLYVTINIAYLSVLAPSEIAASRFAPSDVMAKLFGEVGHKVMTLLSLVVFFGALSSTILATVRVTFALARDGLAPRGLARMSKSQSPVIALCTAASIALVFTLARGFSQILSIYFLAAAVLFGLAYASLLVFRHRDPPEGPPKHVFRAPGGPVIALLLILTQLAMGAMIVVESPLDSLYTVLLLASLAVIYKVWRRFVPATARGKVA
ncbi:MAG: amino acid permease [Deltaproteobacteria bacterium]|jgi:APA family basic amino acid/polyamine antiporter